jgi:hypothetical protein
VWALLRLQKIKKSEHLDLISRNNCPGTDISIGCDTALNVIVSTADAIKSSGLSSRRRIFIMEGKWRTKYFN